MSAYNPDDPILIAAARESGLDQEAEGELLRYYMVKLLKFGWAGIKTPAESRYMTLVRKAMGKGQDPAKVAARVAASARARQQRRNTYTDASAPTGRVSGRLVDLEAS